MTGIFSFNLPRLWNQKPHTGHGYVSPTQLLEKQAKQNLKRMFDPAPDPQLQKLFVQAHPIDAQTFENPFNPMFDVAATPAEVMTNTAENVAEATENVLTEIETPATIQTQYAASSLIATATGLLKALPGKMFLVAMAPFLLYHYNQQRELSCVTFKIKVAQSKLVVIKVQSQETTRSFAFEVAPGKAVTAPKKRTLADRTTAGPLPSNNNSRSFFWNYVAAPFTGYLLPRYTKKELIHIIIEDPLIEKATTNFLESSSPHESIRFTHTPTPVTKAAFMADPNGAHEKGSCWEWDKINGIGVSIEDPTDTDEHVDPIQLPNFSGSITQKLNQEPAVRSQYSE